MIEVAARGSAGADAHGPALAQETVLQVEGLRVHYRTNRGDVFAVNGVDFRVFEGETLGLVGESGCGKTTAAMAVMRLVQPPGRILGGRILLRGTDILSLGEAALRKVRWRHVALIPQGAMNALNPVMRVKDQIADCIETHEGRQPPDWLKQRILDLLTMVGLPSRAYSMYPHQLSGGMKQRVCIAMAVALGPELVIADEPTSALDVVVQRVVTQSLLEVKERLGLSMILIGHDMGLQAQLADRIAVMYAGNMVEIAPATSLFESPLHPYTELLISSIPSIRQKSPLVVTQGLTHDPRNPPPGCIFQLRCPHAMDICRQEAPPLRELEPRHYVACYLNGEHRRKEK